MSRPINFLLLNKSELEYEVRVRLTEPASDVQALKNQLISLSQRLTSEDILESTLPLEEDVSQIESVLNYTSSKLDQLEKKFSNTANKRVETYLNHLYYRLERLECSPSFLEKITELRVLFETLEKKFLLLKNDNEQTFFEVASGHHSSVISAKDQPIVVNSTPFQQPIGSVLSDLRRIAYSGDGCPRSFLLKLDELRISRGLPSDRLLDHASEIFSGRALHWVRFQRQRNPSITWVTLSELLVKDFGSYDYDFKLLSAINSRTQGVDEPIIIYVAVMSGMFSRLNNKLSEQQQLDILFRNIRPCYSVFVALGDIVSIDALIQNCQKYERFLDRDRSFKEPQCSDSQFGEFSYSPLYGKPKPSTSNSPAVNAISVRRKFNAYEYCLRCRTNGHTLDGCTMPRDIVCFGCGLKGYKKPDCPSCRPKGASTTSNKKN